jgi:hypothetical protein
MEIVNYRKPSQAAARFVQPVLVRVRDFVTRVLSTLTLYILITTKAINIKSYLK